MKAAALTGAAAFVFYPAFVGLFLRWREPVSYYDHAVFVPIVCAWMAWRDRNVSDKAAAVRFPWAFFGSPWVALFILLFSLLLEFGGSFQQITFVQGSALVLWIWGCVLWFGGARCFRRHLWPLLYLLLLIPVPSFFMAQLTLGMRELSTSLASASLHGLMAVSGQSFARIGNTLDFAGFRVVIVDACSGMNTLITVIAIGMILVYLETSRARAWLITALLIPVAIIANLIRILAICFFVALRWEYFASGPGHPLLGVFTTLLAFLLLAFGIRIPLKWDVVKKTVQEKGPSKNPVSPEKSRFRLVVFSVVILCAVLVSARLRSQLDTVASLSDSSSGKEVIPNLMFPDWRKTETPMDPATFAIVGTRDAHMFQFDPVRPSRGINDPNPVYFYWLYSANSRKIAHPPELCYRGDGYEILERRQTGLSVNGRTIPAVRMVVQRGHYRLLVYYWYRIGGVEMASYLQQQGEWLLNQLKRFAFGTGSTDGSRVVGSQEGSMLRVSTEIARVVSQSGSSASLDAAKSVADAESRVLRWVSEEDRQNRP